jgi:hypothetical protein
MRSFMKLTGAIAVTLIFGLQVRASGIDQAPAFDVDVAIAFAVDSSSSIDRGTADLQRNGHVAALTSPEFIKALSSNHFGCIGITYFEWASPQQIRMVLPWTRICGRQDAEAAAGVISRTGATGFSRGVRGGTSISAAIGVASLLLDRFPGNADRKVIDISGNGENNDGVPVLQARKKAIDKGYTINAIAIPSKNEAALGRPLTSYFAEDVIGGFQAFVMVPRSASDYTTALRRKLVTEIALNIDPHLKNSEKRPEWRLVTTVADARYGASKW